MPMNFNDLRRLFPVFPVFPVVFVCHPSIRARITCVHAAVLANRPGLPGGRLSWRRAYPLHIYPTSDPTELAGAWKPAPLRGFNVLYREVGRGPLGFR